MKVSIVIVTYKEVPELLNCLKTLEKIAVPPQFEVIVVDNNSESTLKVSLAKKFPRVIYIKTGKNLGFGAGNNVGARRAHGEYLFFLNPDTKIEPKAVRELVNFFKQTPKAGVVAPTLLSMDGIPYADQGSATLTPLSAFAAHSIFHRFWPNNPMAQHYWLRDRDLTQPQRVDVVPGTALMIRRHIFEKIGGFDERFFIYFEESDLCRRVAQTGWQMWIIPSARVRHIWHAATQGSMYRTIYAESRYKYFQKYDGSLIAQLVEIALKINKWTIIILMGFALFGLGLLMRIVFFHLSR